MEEKSFSETVRKVAKEVYGKKRVDLNPEALIIHYPQIRITNNLNEEHMIKDLYVQLPMRSRSFTSHIKGFRGTLSYPEYVSTYVHSHLNGINQSFWGFCLGADGINVLWNELKIADYETAEDYELQLESFFHQLNSFVAYESIEGGPFRRIGRISPYTDNGLSHNQVSIQMRKIWGGIDDSDFDLSMDLNTGQVHLVEADYLHNVLASLVEIHQTRDAAGNYRNVDEGGEDFEGTELSNHYIYFKGKKVKTKVEPYKFSDYETNSRKFCHKDIFKSFKNHIEEKGRARLEQILSKQYIAEYKAKEEGKDHTVRTFDSANLVRVSQAAG